MTGLLLRDVFNFTAPPLLPLERGREACPLRFPKPHFASAEVKHPLFQPIDGFLHVLPVCAGKNDFKLLSAQLLVHASQSHSDKPVTTQRRPLEKSTRAGL